MLLLPVYHNVILAVALLHPIIAFKMMLYFCRGFDFFFFFFFSNNYDVYT